MRTSGALSRVVGLFAACVTALHTGSACAQAADAASQGAIEEVVVTATKQSQSVQKVPISISAYTQADLDALGARTLADVAQLSPGVDFSQNSSFPAFNIAIRGISSTTSSPTTVAYLDDTPLSTRTTAQSFAGSPMPQAFDLDHVEVLRGPQGSLFGAGAEGGVIRFISPTPDLKNFSASMRAEAGFTIDGAPSYEAGLAAGGPIVDDELGFRVSAWYRRDGGYVDQVTSPLGAGPFTLATVPGTGGALVEPNANYSDVRVVRAALKIAASDQLTLEPALYYQRSYTHDSSSFDTSLSNPGEGQFNQATKSLTPAGDRFVLPSLKMVYKLAFADLTSVTSYFSRNATASTDYTEYQTFAFFGNPWQLLPCLPAGPNCPPNEVAHSYEDTVQTKWTQELRMSSVNPQARVSWVAGLYFEHAYQDDSEYAYNNDIAQLLNTYYGVPLATAVQNVLGAPLVDGIWLYTGHTYSVDQQTAAFGEANYRLTSTLKLTAGLRVEHTVSSFKQPLGGPFNGGSLYAQGTQNENPVNPHFGVSWQPTDDALLYASAARGFRPGGSNAQPSTTPTCVAALKQFGLADGVPATYNSDSVWSYEMGAKLRFADERIQLDGSIFHIDWKNIQTSTLINGCGSGETLNLGAATSNGFDLALNANVTSQLSFAMALSNVKATYNQTIGQGANTVVTKGDWVGGATFSNLPSPWTVTGTLQYRTDILFGHEWYVRIDDIFHSANHGPVQSQNPADDLSYDPVLALNPSTNRLNGRIGTQLGNLDLSLFADNILNSRPVLWEFQAPLTGDNRISASSFRPLTIGVTAKLRM